MGNNNEKKITEEKRPILDFSLHATNTKHLDIGLMTKPSNDNKNNGGDKQSKN